LKNRPTATLPRPCTGALGTDFPLEARHSHIQRGTSPPQAALGAGGDWLLSMNGPELTKLPLIEVVNGNSN